MKKQWKQVTPHVWVCDEWAVEQDEYSVTLYRNGESVRDFATVEKAKRGANQKTLDQVAAWREEYRRKPPGLAKLSVIQG